jgi:hypothetical protein
MSVDELPVKSDKCFHKNKIITSDKAKNKSSTITCIFYILCKVHRFFTLLFNGSRNPGKIIAGIRSETLQK